MKIKNEFFEDGSLEELNKLRDMNLPIEDSFRIMKLIKQLDLVGKVYIEAKQKLLETYGTPNKENTQYSFPDPVNNKKFSEEFRKLLNIEEDIDFEKVGLDKEGIKVTPKFLLALENFIKIKE